MTSCCDDADENIASSYGSTSQYQQQRLDNNTSCCTTDLQQQRNLRLLLVPVDLKRRIGSFLGPSDALSWSGTCQAVYRELALSRLPLKICFKSWYGSRSTAQAAAAASASATNAKKNRPKRGPPIPFLRDRTHSVTLTGSWSHQGAPSSSNLSRCEFYVIAHRAAPTMTTAGRGISSDNDNQQQQQRAHHRTSSNCGLPFDGGRVVWASPLESVSWDSDTWAKFTITFVPRNDETYHLYIQSGPRKHMLGHSLHVSNLMAHIMIYDEYAASSTLTALSSSSSCSQQPLIRQYYQTLVQHISGSGALCASRVCAFYTKMLQAIARSIRMQLLLANNNSTSCAALDPLLEKLCCVPKDTESLLILEEIARFLSDYAYVNERRRLATLSGAAATANDDDQQNTAQLLDYRSAASSGSGTQEGTIDSVPDWIPYTEGSNSSNTLLPPAVAADVATMCDIDQVTTEDYGSNRSLGIVGTINNNNNEDAAAGYTNTTRTTYHRYLSWEEGRAAAAAGGGTAAGDGGTAKSAALLFGNSSDPKRRGRKIESCRRVLANLFRRRKHNAHFLRQARNKDYGSEEFTASLRTSDDAVDGDKEGFALVDLN